MVEEETQFLDAEAQFSKESTSFKDLILRQMERLVVICTKEFKEGYWESKPITIGSGIVMSKVWHEDTREAYINTMLRSVV